MYLRYLIFGFFTVVSLLEIFVQQNMILSIVFGMIGLTFLHEKG